MTEKLKEFMFSIVYRLIYFTNDLANEIATTTNTSANYELTYKLIHELNCIHAVIDDYDDYDVKFYQPLLEELAKKAFTDITIVNLNVRPFDCWKYLPELLHYIYGNATVDSANINFHHYIIDTIVRRLLIDNIKIKIGMTPSTLAFWLPKEKSKQFGYLTHPISYHLFSSWIKTAEDISCPSSLDRAKTKCLTHYRKLMTEIKTHLDIDTLRALKISSIPIDTVNTNPNNFWKYNSYSYLLSDLCKEHFIETNQEMSELWETILYGDMPGLISTEGTIVEEVDEVEVDEVDEVDTTVIENKGWFSWLW